MPPANFCCCANAAAALNRKSSANQFALIFRGILAKYPTNWGTNRSSCLTVDSIVVNYCLSIVATVVAVGQTAVAAAIDEVALDFDCSEDAFFFFFFLV